MRVSGGARVARGFVGVMIADVKREGRPGVSKERQSGERIEDRHGVVVVAGGPHRNREENLL